MVDTEVVEHEILSHPRPVVTIGDILESLSEETSDTTVRNRMEILEAAGKLESIKPGARSRVWWHTERVLPPQVGPGDHPDQSDLTDVDPHREPDSAQSDPSDWLTHLDTPPSTPSRESFESAAQSLIDHIRSQGQTSRSDAVEEIANDFESGYSNNRTWWRRIGRPVLEEHPDVIAPKSGASTWHWKGSQ